MGETILSLKNITKLFPGVRALDDVSVEFEKGEIHAIVGENGAGKSTLIKVLAGAHSPTSGSIQVLGNEYNSTSHYTPSESVKLGVAVIYQEFNLIPYLTVAENVFFGRETTSNGFLKKKHMENETRKLCATMGIDLDPTIQVKDLSVAFQQIVEIVKILSWEAKIVVMDEPTAPLTNTEIGFLFSIVRKLKEKGVTVIYISHRLEEVFDLCDRVSVMRDGKYVTT
jgi:ribose transport system ATP-binding protein